MAYQSIWYQTKLPQTIIDTFSEEQSQNLVLENGSVGNIGEEVLRKNIRNSKVGWVSDSNWFCSMLHYYVMKSNQENFLYDIRGFESNHLQYTLYDETNYYKWHSDSVLSSYYLPTFNSEENTLKISSEVIRKLTVSVQLSDESDYVGGELQIMDETSRVYNVPKEKGTVIIFDSRARHRVRKIKSGIRKSLVGWVVGPRWK